jgi:antitoxin ParD1/3/4
MRELIRADEKLKAEEQLEAKLLEGLNSPESEFSGEDWKEIRKEALMLLESRKARR